MKMQLFLLSDILLPRSVTTGNHLLPSQSFTWSVRTIAWFPHKWRPGKAEFPVNKVSIGKSIRKQVGKLQRWDWTALEIKMISVEDACRDVKGKKLGRCEVLQGHKQWRRSLPFGRGVAYVHLFSVLMVSHLKQPAVSHNRWAPPDSMSRICWLHLMYLWGNLSARC